MRMGQARACGLLLAFGATTGGCGVAAERAPAASPVLAEPSADKSVTESVAGPPRESPPPPPAPPSAATVAAPIVPGTARGGAAGDASGARSDLALAERQLQSSAGDCTTACRALGSMERATAHLCEMPSSSADQGSCQDAKARVLAGRDRVRASCGECPGGPSLDRNAPIPSSR
jgi:hypothetical protein